MATRSADKDLENGIKVALDAADTASGVTEEFNNVREQFEVVNIQAKRIYQSVLIIFVSANSYPSKPKPTTHPLAISLKNDVCLKSSRAKTLEICTS